MVCQVEIGQNIEIKSNIVWNFIVQSDLVSYLEDYTVKLHRKHIKSYSV